MLVGQFNSGNRALRNDVFRAMGKLSFIAALIHPFVILYFYSAPEKGLFLTFSGVFYLGIGNILCELTLSFLIFLVIEFPLKQIVTIVFEPKLHSRDTIAQYLHLKAQGEDNRATFKPELFNKGD